MAKQLQIRRGTTAHNAVFTGAIGEMTVDTQRKDLRLHDGVKQGGYEIPTIIEQQLPSADNDYTWFIKYSNGWCEQGGCIKYASPSGPIVVTMPVEMADAKYQTSITLSADTGPFTSTASADWFTIWNRTTTGFTLRRFDAQTIQQMWEIKGLYKQGE